jgi:hypothetical protein
MAAVTEFVAVNWNANQLIDEDSLDQINSNLNWLKDHSLTGQLQSATGYPTSTGLKILAGKSVIPALGTPWIYYDVYFAKSFTPNSSPVITASAWTGNQTSAINVIGLDGTSSYDHRGFKVNLYPVVNAPYTVNPIVNWIAIGY